MRLSHLLHFPLSLPEKTSKTGQFYLRILKSVVPILWISHGKIAIATKEYK